MTKAKGVCDTFGDPRLHRRLAAYARSRGVPVDLIEDCALEFVERAISRDLERYAAIPVSRRSAYVRCAFRNFLRDFTRRLTTVRAAEFTNIEVDQEEFCAKGEVLDAPQEAAISNAARGALATAIARLAPSRRDVLVMFHIQELSVKRIGTVTGRSEAAIRRCLCDARRQVCAALERHGWSYYDLIGHCRYIMGGGQLSILEDVVSPQDR